MTKQFIKLIVGLQLLIAAVLLICTSPVHAASDSCLSYQKDLTKTAVDVFGTDAPVPLLIGQLRQESSCRDDITAWDNGRGAAQFMDATAKQVSTMFPELGPPDPYNRKWALAAMSKLDNYNDEHVKGKDECEKWGAALKGYNSGLGYPQRAQKVSDQPLIWFGKTELLNKGQSDKNFEYSRMYPVWILGTHQKLYQDWGLITCEDYMRKGFPYPKQRLPSQK